ncbi:MAG: hypothetical protein R2876_07285 [Eubacteriales bacterium]
MKKLLSVLLVFTMIFITMPQISSPALAQVEATASSERTTTLNLYNTAALRALAAEDDVTLDDGIYTNTVQGWSYDTNLTPKTLTLSGVNINVSSNDETTYGIHLPANSKIVLADGTTNTINGSDMSTGSSSAIYAEGTLSIEGDGTLIAAGGDASLDSYGISSYGGTIDINGGTITADGGDASNESIGIYANMNEDGYGGVINISGGTVSATGATAKGSSGILARGNNASGGAKVIISGGEITALGGTSSEYQSFGICAKFGRIAINKTACISATAGSSNSVSYGIYADANTTEDANNGKNKNDGEITISGGEITALGGTAGSSYGIFAIGAIEIRKSTVNATGGTSTNVGTTGIASESGGITIDGTETTVNATGGTAKLSRENAEEGGYANSMGIYALGGDVLIDDNAVVNASGGTSESESICGIHLNKSFQDGSGGTLAIGGDATVTAVGGIIVNMQNSFGNAAFIVNGNASVDISTADIEEGENSGISITNGYMIISEKANVTINAGGGKYNSFGIVIVLDSESVGDNAGENDGKLIMTGGNLEASSAKAKNSKAIFAQGDIELSGGTIVAQSGEATEETSAGISSNEKIIINGSAYITAKSGKAKSLSAAVYANSGIKIEPSLAVFTPLDGGVSKNGKYISVTDGVNDDYATDVEIEPISASNTKVIIWIALPVAIVVAGLLIGVIVLILKKKKSQTEA